MIQNFIYFFVLLVKESFYIPISYFKLFLLFETAQVSFNSSTMMSYLLVGMNYPSPSYYWYDRRSPLIAVAADAADAATVMGSVAWKTAAFIKTPHHLPVKK